MATGMLGTELHNDLGGGQGSVYDHSNRKTPRLVVQAFPHLQLGAIPVLWSFPDGYPKRLLLLRISLHLFILFLSRTRILLFVLKN
jgi:hypothetical protein